MCRGQGAPFADCAICVGVGAWVSFCKYVCVCRGGGGVGGGGGRARGSKYINEPDGNDSENIQHPNTHPTSKYTTTSKHTNIIITHGQNVGTFSLKAFF